jgi:hypothetical protein
MKLSHFLLTAALTSLWFAGTLSAADIKIIANANVGASNVSADDLKSIFLATKTSWADGSHVEPVLQKSGPAHETFVKDFLGKTEAALDNYYRSLLFTGKGTMPKTLPSDAETLAYVAKTKGAVGYVSSGTGTDTVKVLTVK